MDYGGISGVRAGGATSAAAQSSLQIRTGPHARSKPIEIVGPKGSDRPRRVGGPGSVKGADWNQAGSPTELRHEQ